MEFMSCILLLPLFTCYISLLQCSCYSKDWKAITLNDGSAINFPLCRQIRRLLGGKTMETVLRLNR